MQCTPIPKINIKTGKCSATEKVSATHLQPHQLPMPQLHSVDLPPHLAHHILAHGGVQHLLQTHEEKRQGVASVNHAESVDVERGT